MDLTRNARSLEFQELYQEAGMEPVELAKRLQVTTASISRYRSGVQTPKGATLDLFRRIVEERKRGKAVSYPPHEGEGMMMMDAPVRDAAQKLGELREMAPDSFKTVNEVISTLHKAAKASSSSVNAAVNAGASDVAVKVSNRPAGYYPSRATGGHSARKSARPRSTHKPSEKPSGPQGPAPK